ncbi:MAG: amidohydrolase family protein, partial [Fusobacteriaceae bacterium]
HKDGKCFGEDGTLGGSALTMIGGVQNLVRHANIRLEEAVKMATLYPAKAIKVDDRYGRLQPGYFADIVIMDNNLELTGVISKGLKI